MVIQIFKAELGKKIKSILSIYEHLRRKKKGESKQVKKSEFRYFFTFRTMQNKFQVYLDIFKNQNLMNI